MHTGPGWQEEGTMRRLTERLTGRGKEAARAAYDRLETKVLVAEGRKSVGKKVRTVSKVGKKAVKAGMVVGVLTAAGVVVREIRKRRKLNA